MRTGKRCVTFTQFPVAFCGGRREKTAPRSRAEALHPAAQGNPRIHVDRQRHSLAWPDRGKVGFLEVGVHPPVPSSTIVNRVCPDCTTCRGRRVRFETQPSAGAVTRACDSASSACARRWSKDGASGAATTAKARLPRPAGRRQARQGSDNAYGPRLSRLRRSGPGMRSRRSGHASAKRHRKRLFAARRLGRPIVRGLERALHRRKVEGARESGTTGRRLPCREATRPLCTPREARGALTFGKSVR